ncbi:MAG: DUF1887 family CARF protein [Dissulfuribacterales bacterium]
MSRHIHICLISAQTVPNILGLLHFQPVDKIIFITTEQMQKRQKIEAILNTLKLRNMVYPYESVIVNQDCFDDCLMKLSTMSFKDDDEITVNVTGGNKLMSIAAYKVFSSDRYKNIKIIYTPFPENEFNVIFPVSSECKEPIKCNIRLKIKEYITAYGLKINNDSEISNNRAQQNKKIAEFIAINYEQLSYLLNQFYKHLCVYRKAKQPIDCIINYPLTHHNNIAEELLKLLNFSIEFKDSAVIVHKTINKYNARFLTGDWLSDYCYNSIKSLVDDCVTGIHLQTSKGNQNEFDILFTKDNALYIIECKSLHQEADKGTDILYKIYSLQQEFGLKVKGFLVSTARKNLVSEKDNQIKQHLAARAKACNTEIIHPDKIGELSEWFKEKFPTKE